MVEYLIFSELIKRENVSLVVSLLNQVLIETVKYKNDYPNYEEWFWDKQVRGLFDGNRDIIVAIKNNKVIGISNIKNTLEEKKICTLTVDKRYRMKTVGSKLVDISTLMLGTTTPVITMSMDKLSDFSGIIKKYNWEITGVKKELYKEDVYEVIINDFCNASLELEEKILIRNMNFRIYKIIYAIRKLFKNVRKIGENNYGKKCLD